MAEAVYSDPGRLPVYCATAARRLVTSPSVALAHSGRVKTSSSLGGCPGLSCSSRAVLANRPPPASAPSVLRAAARRSRRQGQRPPRRMARRSDSVLATALQRRHEPMGKRVCGYVFASTLTAPIAIFGSGSDTLTVNGDNSPTNVITKTHGQITWGSPVTETVSYSGI